jgi:4'-phosphopantetheinyl transferase
MAGIASHTSAASLWRTGPVRPVLEAGEVHLWLARLEAGLWDLASLRVTLSEAELQRAERFRYQRDRMGYVLAHGMRRMVLGRYVHGEAGELAFGNAAKGKPALCMGGEIDRIRFSLSHSGEYALLAVALDQEVGADLEQMRGEIEFAPLAGQFSVCEAAWLASLPAEARREAFFALWTCKEACVKATGEGLSCPLDQFDVTVAAEMEPSAVWLGEDQWQVVRLPAPGGYAAAVAVGGAKPMLRLWAASDH